MIEFDNVKKTYPSGVEALKGINFLVEDGEFVFIIGKSGSGKSTLLKCITREEKPTEGKVTIDHFDISKMSRSLVPVLRRQLGMIYQDFRLIETKTVAENVAFAGEIIGQHKKALNQTVNLVLSIVGLKGKENCFPQELSGGEQQRVAIARAMLNNPQIIVADEPTGNLDPETSESIMALLQEINKNGTTVIVCTHDSNLVDRMKKRVIEIDKGYIVRDALGGAYSGERNVETPETAEFGGYGVDDDPADDYKDYWDESDVRESADDSVDDIDNIDDVDEVEKPAVTDISFGDSETQIHASAIAKKEQEKKEAEAEASDVTSEDKKEEKQDEESSDSWIDELSIDDIDLLDSEEE